MASYVVVGASRGLGFEFVRQISANAANTVIALVRNVESAKEKFDSELGRKNVHLLRYDLDDPATIPGAVEGTSKITGGKLDYLIANAGVGGSHYGAKISELAQKPQDLEKDFVDTFRTNVVGVAQIIGAFMPLVLKGTAKKVFALSTGLGEVEFTRENDMWMASSYSVSKAALNMVIAKFSAEFREQGVLFLAISPGVVDTGFSPPDAQDAMMALGGKVMAYEPSWKGPIQPEESVRQVLAVVEKNKVDGGNAGALLSHLGNQRWV
ncbi:NAD(P)-binding protein [Sarocladium strictum]